MSWRRFIGRFIPLSWGYKVFLKLARKIAPKEEVDERWGEMLDAEARILARQEPGPRIHSGWV